MRIAKGYGAKRMLKEFPNKNWSLAGVKRLLKNITATGSSARKTRPVTKRTPDIIAAVDELIMSQESQPGTHRTLTEIAREIEVSRYTVHQIVHKDLKLKCLKKKRAQELTESNKLARLVRAKQLLRHYPQSKVDFIWFTDEKMFTVATPKNPQNDRLYVPIVTRKKQIPAARLLQTRTTFTKSVMVSVAVSALGATELIFIDPGVKINGAYYRDVLLSQHLLPAIKAVSGEFFVFQQDSAPAHRAYETVEMLRQNTPEFIPPS
jgi:inhibitor of nuclear factor kappa-B kinase subunit alpha